MKTLKLIAVCLMIVLSTAAQSQTIAVAPIKSFGLFSSSNTCTKLTQLELVKLNKYAVMDKFDMNELTKPSDYDSCFGKTCLIEYGQTLGADFILSGNIDGLGDKIVVSYKVIDVTAQAVSKSLSIEFDNMEEELQRMIGIVLQEMHGLIPDPELKKQLIFKNEVIISNNIGRINNSGPRMGLAYTTGAVNEFLTRPEIEGGLDIAPLVSNIGYQFEGQYVGTEKFSALIECLIMFSGLEQGKFIPSISVMNGYRFGNSGWEFAFGPSFSLSTYSMGFFDKNEIYGPKDKYWTSSDLVSAGFDPNGIDEYDYTWKKTLDARGDLEFSTRWVMAFGRTFRSGALNIPVNIFYSSQKGGGMAGVSVGFNIVRSKKSVKTN